MPDDKDLWGGLDPEQIRAKLLAGVNFEQVHTELMAAVRGVAAGKGCCDFVEVPELGTTTRIFDAVQRALQFLLEPFTPNDLEIVDRAFASLGKTRQSIRKNEVALEILESLLVEH